jgi:hypothetical protein
LVVIQFHFKVHHPYNIKKKGWRCLLIGMCCLFTENHILEDVNKCVLALQEGDFDTLDRTAGAIRGRSSRVCNVVGAEMDNYEPGIYTERVLEAVKVLRDQGKHADTVGCVDP